MPLFFKSAVPGGNYQTAALSNILPTPIVITSVTSTVAGQIVLVWTGGVGNNVKNTFKLSNGTATISGASTVVSNGISTATITFSPTTVITTTVTVTVTVLDGSTSATSNSVTTTSPVAVAAYNTISSTGLLYLYTFDQAGLVGTKTISTAIPSGQWTYSEIANYATGTASFEGSIIAGTGTGYTYATFLNTTNKVAGTSSLYFPGTGGFKPSNAAPILGSSGISVSWWMNTTMTPSNTFLWNLMGTSLRGDIMYPVYVNIISSTSIGIYTGTSTPSSNTLVTHTVTIPTVNDGNWHHFVVTHSGAGSLTVYRNGSSISTNSSFPYPFNNSAIPQDWLSIGCNINNGNYNFDGARYTGYIDNYRIYTRVITGSEVAVLYNNNS